MSDLQTYRFPQDGRCYGHPHAEWWDRDLDLSGRGVREPPEAKAARIGRAQAECARCPVRDLCENARNPKLDEGVWAGELYELGETAGYGQPQGVQRKRWRAKRAS